MRFTVLRSKAVSRWICDKQQQPPVLVNYVCITRQWDFKIQCFGRLGKLFFFPEFLALKTWFELSGVKLCGNDLRGLKNYMYVRLVN